MTSRRRLTPFGPPPYGVSPSVWDDLRQRLADVEELAAHARLCLGFGDTTGADVSLQLMRKHTDVALPAGADAPDVEVASRAQP